MTLMNKCCNSDEALAVLNEPVPNLRHCKDKKFPRLSLAVQYELKEFVYHPQCQNVLVSEWFGDEQEWRWYGMLGVFLIILARVLFLPVAAILIWFKIQTKCGKAFQEPIQKFVCDVASHVCFLMIILTQVQ